jgi:hypothetical protein
MECLRSPCLSLREIGIHMALGAEARDAGHGDQTGNVAGRVWWPRWCSRCLRVHARDEDLFQVSATDPTLCWFRSYGGSQFIACYLPARRGESRSARGPTIRMRAEMSEFSNGTLHSLERC